MTGKAPRPTDAETARSVENRGPTLLSRMAWRVRNASLTEVVAGSAIVGLGAVILRPLVDQVVVTGQEQRQDQEQLRQALKDKGDTITDVSELDFAPVTTVDTDTLNPEGAVVAWDVGNSPERGQVDRRLPYAHLVPEQFGARGGAQFAVSLTASETGLMLRKKTFSAHLVTVREKPTSDRQTRTEMLHLNETTAARDTKNRATTQNPFLVADFTGPDGRQYMVRAYDTPPVEVGFGSQVSASVETIEYGADLAPVKMTTDQVVTNGVFGVITAGFPSIGR